MEVFRGIKRRMELFEGFAEGKRLLRDRHIEVKRGEGERTDAPTVFVWRGTRAKSGVRNVSVLLFSPDGPTLAYAAAEEIDDYLAAILGFRRRRLEDERRDEGFFLKLEYEFPLKRQKN